MPQQLSPLTVAAPSAHHGLRPGGGLRLRVWLLAFALVGACDGSLDVEPSGDSGAPDAPLDAGDPVDAAGAHDASDHEDAMPEDADITDGSAPIDARPSPDAEPPCTGSCLRWPVVGTRGDNWGIHNYVDLDITGGLRDYRGNVGPLARTYNQHQGVDITIANFRAMDRGVDVVAATPGRVRRTVNDQMDRNMSCVTPDWNVVEVDGDDGLLYLYGHLRRGSVAVSVGDRVETGDRLGEVGSSGCSTAPHLHFEILDASGEPICPFLTEMWASPPLYDVPYRIMDISLRRGDYGSADELKDPGPNLGSTSVSSRIGVGISASGGLTEDILLFELRDPSGATFSSFPSTLRVAGRHSRWFWNVDVGATPGMWTVHGSTATDSASIRFQVTP